MHRPGADPLDMNPEDFWCDFCRRPWSEQVPFVEGHRGSCICGNCLSIAWIAVETNDPELVRGEFFCVMSQESTADRAAQNRGDDPGWSSPSGSEAVISRKMIRMAAAVLSQDPENNWQKPTLPPQSSE